MTYQMRAYRFIRAMFDHVTNWGYYRDIENAIKEVYFEIGEVATVTNGSSRMVVVGEDFVIKWDYDYESIETIGGCEDEFRVYKWSLSTGYSYLLAPVFRVYYRKHFFFIMPRVFNIGYEEHEYKEIDEFLSTDEYEWLVHHIGDLHSWNWGFDANNNPVVIDYACRPDRD